MKLSDFEFNSIDEKPFDVQSLVGKKVMIVNTASECGLTPQFEQLEALFQQFKTANFTILGFPSNDFGAQDPGSNEEIAEFCQRNYGVTFPMMEKIVVKGNNQHPLFQWLTAHAGEEVQWNFHKFLIDDKGEFLMALSPSTLPIEENIIAWIEN